MVTWSDGKELDSTWSRGENLPFAGATNLGRASVVRGWDEGLPGIREGGRRLIVVPPDARTAGESASGDTLVYVVDAVSVRRADRVTGSAAASRWCGGLPGPRAPSAASASG